MKMNLIIDGNYIMTKNAFALNRDNMLYGGLPQAMMTVFKKYLNMYEWNQVFFVSDSRKKSWRVNYDSDYKSTRKKKEEVDWDFVYEVYEQFKHLLQVKEKAIVLESDTVEGDDWIYAITKKSNAKNIGVAYVSADRDLLQLLDYNQLEPWINIQLEDNTKGLPIAFVHAGYPLVVSKLKPKEKTINTNPFDIKEDTTSIIDGLTGTWDLRPVNPKHELLKKIICGDKSDNIKSIHVVVKETKAGTRNMGVGPAGADKIINEFTKISGTEELTYNTSDDSLLDVITECLNKIGKHDLSDSEKIDVKNNIKSNSKIIELHHKNFPREIKQKIGEMLNGIL